MKVSYSKGVAIHTDPESCVRTGNRAGEALTGARAGQVLSRESKINFGGPTASSVRKATWIRSLVAARKWPFSFFDSARQRLGPLKISSPRVEYRGSDAFTRFQSGIRLGSAYVERGWT